MWRYVKICEDMLRNMKMRQVMWRCVKIYENSEISEDVLDMSQ